MKEIILNSNKYYYSYCTDNGRSHEIILFQKEKVKRKKYYFFGREIEVNKYKKMFSIYIGAYIEHDSLFNETIFNRERLIKFLESQVSIYNNSIVL